MHYLSIAGISLLPVLLGSLCYWLYFIPDLGAFLFRLIPVIMIVIWYQAGKWIAGRVRRPAAAYFGCHWSLWFCLLVHVWQLYLLSPSDRSFFWFQLGNSVSNPGDLLFQPLSPAVWGARQHHPAAAQSGVPFRHFLAGLFAAPPPAGGRRSPRDGLAQKTNRNNKNRAGAKAPSRFFFYVPQRLTAPAAGRRRAPKR